MIVCNGNSELWTVTCFTLKINHIWSNHTEETADELWVVSDEKETWKKFRFWIRTPKPRWVMLALSNVDWLKKLPTGLSCIRSVQRPSNPFKFSECLFFFGTLSQIVITALSRNERRIVFARVRRFLNKRSTQKSVKVFHSTASVPNSTRDNIQDGCFSIKL